MTLTENAIALQIQCQSLDAQIQAEGLKEYAADWLKNGGKVVRDASGKFASKPGMSDSQKALVDKVASQTKKFPIAGLPKSSYGPRVVKTLEKLAASDQALKSYRDQAASLHQMAGEISKIKDNKQYTDAMQKMIDAGISSLEKATAKELKTREGRRQAAAAAMTLAAIGTALGYAVKAYWGVSHIPGKVTVGAINVGKAARKVAEGVNQKIKGVNQKIKQTEQKYQVTNQKNIEEIAKRYQKDWQKDQSSWASKAASETEKAVSAITKNLLSVENNSSVAAAKEESKPSSPLEDLADDVKAVLDTGEIDLGFVLYLLSKSDFREAIMPAIMETISL